MIFVVRILSLVAKSQDLLLNDLQQNKLELVQQNCDSGQDLYAIDNYLILEAEQELRQYVKDLEPIHNLYQSIQQIKQDYGYNEPINKNRIKYGYQRINREQHNDEERNREQHHDEERNEHHQAKPKNHDVLSILRRIALETSIILNKKDYLFVDEEQLNQLLQYLSLWESDVNFFLDLAGKMDASDEEKQHAKIAFNNCDAQAQQAIKRVYGSIVTNKKTKQLKKNGILNQKLKSRRNHKK